MTERQDDQAAADDGSWLTEEFARARARAASLPRWALPVVTRPAATKATP